MEPLSAVNPADDPAFNVDKLRAYISHVKRIDPELSREAGELLRAFFTSQRRYVFDWGVSRSLLPPATNPFVGQTKIQPTERRTAMNPEGQLFGSWKA